MSSACQVVFVNPHNENIGDSKMMNMMQTAPENRGVDVGSPNLRVPRIEIVEQPASKALRFRYECEGRSAGSIPGVHSTAENRTYPTVRIVGYTGNDDIVMIVSCVTKDAPHKAHPHNLVGRECKDGICSIFVDRETKTATFSNLGIQCVKKKDIESALKLRETKKVDPFKQGFEHAKNPSQIDLNSVRLCFQAIVKSQNARLLAPAVVSDPIYDKKAMSDLLITRLSHVSASVKGGTDVILLCEKVAKEDIKVRFYEETQGHQTWESFGDISLVHKQVAIAFKTPPYKTLEVDRTVDAFIQLFRPSDKATSESLPFKFTPIEPGPPRRKTPKLLDDLLQMDRIRTQNPTIFDNSTHATAFSVKSEPRSPPEFIPSPLAPVVCTSPYPECQASSTFQMSPNPIYNNPIPGPSSQLPQFGDFRQLPSESGSPFTKQDYINTEMHVGCSVIQPDLSMMGSQLLQLTTCAQTFPNQPEPNQNSFESYLHNMPTDNPMASVEERIDRNDLLNPGGLQELSESLSHVNISREDSLTRLTNEAFELYERNFKQN